MIFYTDAQVFENRKPKKSYIAVVSEQYGAEPDKLYEKLISFLEIPYRQAHDAEGLAILHALKYIAKHKLLFSMIFTDSLVWAGIANGNTKVKGTKEKQLYTRKISENIIKLKKMYHISITWKSRKVNKAGHFLAKVWGFPEEHRKGLNMEVTKWADVSDSESYSAT